MLNCIYIELYQMGCVGEGANIVVKPGSLDTWLL